jgi:hypothetical protein
VAEESNMELWKTSLLVFGGVCSAIAHLFGDEVDVKLSARDCRDSRDLGNWLCYVSSALYPDD